MDLCVESDIRPVTGTDSCDRREAGCHWCHLLQALSPHLSDIVGVFLCTQALPLHLGAALQLGKKNDLFIRGHKLVEEYPQQVSGYGKYPISKAILPPISPDVAPTLAMFCPVVFLILPGHVMVR